jgi:hypothetical protein
VSGPSGVWKTAGPGWSVIAFMPVPAARSRPIPAVTPRCEYGLEILVVLAFLVYIIGISLDKACAVLGFFRQLPLSKSQADALLRQLARHWDAEFDLLCALLALCRGRRPSSRPHDQCPPANVANEPNSPLRRFHGRCVIGEDVHELGLEARVPHDTASSTRKTWMGKRSVSSTVSHPGQPRVMIPFPDECLATTAEFVLRCPVGG